MGEQRIRIQPQLFPNVFILLRYYMVVLKNREPADLKKLSFSEPDSNKTNFSFAAMSGPCQAEIIMTRYFLRSYLIVLVQDEAFFI